MKKDYKNVDPILMKRTTCPMICYNCKASGNMTATKYELYNEKIKCPKCGSKLRVNTVELGRRIQERHFKKR